MTVTVTSLVPITSRESRGLGALAARTQMRQINDGTRRELNRAAAWCADRELYIVRGLCYDAWHEGWISEISDALSQM